MTRFGMVISNFLRLLQRMTLEICLREAQGNHIEVLTRCRLPE